MINDKFQKLNLTDDVVTYPKKEVSLNEFSKEEIKLSKSCQLSTKNASFLKLYGRRIKDEPTARVSMALEVTIHTGHFNVEIPKEDVGNYKCAPKRDKGGEDEYDIPTMNWCARQPTSKTSQ